MSVPVTLQQPRCLAAQPRAPWRPHRAAPAGARAARLASGSRGAGQQPVPAQRECRTRATTEAAARQPPTTLNSDAVVEELMAFLREDLQHLFDDQGIDVSRYDERVDFQDPITKYNSLQGYLFNIQFLRWVFDPVFTLHDLRRTGEWEITTRWTMTMRLGHSGGRPRGPPRLTFTGTSIMGINPATGKFDRHYDTWDAVQQQQFFSVEAFLHLLSQVFDLRQTPKIETPAYQVLRKCRDYEVRQYPPFPVAEAPMAAAGAAGASGGGSSGEGVRAFRSLAGYIFGGNQAGEKMAMTTPVLTDGSRSRMQFVLPQRYQEANAPAPLSDSTVVTRRLEGGVFAAGGFSGVARQEVAAEEATKLRRVLLRDGVQPGEGWTLAQYNDPGTAPPFRRNEVLIPLEGFSLW